MTTRFVIALVFLGLAIVLAFLGASAVDTTVTTTSTTLSGDTILSPSLPHGAIIGSAAGGWATAGMYFTLAFLAVWAAYRLVIRM